MTADHDWFGGLTSDHLFENCPARVRSEKTLREFGWWDLRGDDVDPRGTDICGMCVYRYDRKQAAA